MVERDVAAAPPRRRIPPAGHRRSVLDRDLLVHLHRPRAPVVGPVLPVLPSQPGRALRGASTSGTTPATPRPTSCTPGTSGICPSPTRPLTEPALPNGIAYRCLEPLRRYALSYRDPDAGRNRPRTGLSVPSSPSPPSPRPTTSATPTSTSPAATRAPSRWAARRSPWTPSGSATGPGGSRSQFGRGIHGTPARCGGYSYATASDRHAFHAITMDFGTGSVAIHGYLLRDGEWSKVASGTRRVLERDPDTAYPTAGGPRPGRRDRPRSCTRRGGASTGSASSSTPTCTRSTA